MIGNREVSEEQTNFETLIKGRKALQSANRSIPLLQHIVDFASQYWSNAVSLRWSNLVAQW